jgi:hypothetical protein
MKKNKVFRLLTNPLFILLFLLTLLVIISSNDRMGNDEGIWSYIGRIWTDNGIPPYVGAVENKTPGIFGLYAISHVLFGVNVLFVRGLGIIAILLTALTVYHIGKALHGHLAGVLGMTIFGLTMTWKLLDGDYPAQTETFMVLFSTLSFYFLIKGKPSRKWGYWVLLAGISMGLAIAFKQIALASALALCGFFLLYAKPVSTKRSPFAGVILIGLGIALSTLLSLAPLWFSGVSFNEYFHGAWTLLANQGSSSSLKDHIIGFLGIWGNSRMVVFYPCLILLLLQKDLFKYTYFVGLSVWLVIDFLGVNSSGMYYGHQMKQLVPSLSIMIGILLGNILAKFSYDKDLYMKHVSTAILAIILIIFPYQSGLRMIYLNVTGIPDMNKEIGHWLKDHTTARDYVYIVGSQGNPILSYSERVSSSIYFNSMFVTTEKERKKLSSDLIEKPPVYIVKPQAHGDQGELMNTELSMIDPVLENYTFVRSHDNWDIFKRK